MDRDEEVQSCAMSQRSGEEKVKMGRREISMVLWIEGGGRGGKRGNVTLGRGVLGRGEDMPERGLGREGEEGMNAVKVAEHRPSRLSAQGHSASQTAMQFIVLFSLFCRFTIRYLINTRSQLIKETFEAQMPTLQLPCVAERTTSGQRYHHG